MSDNRKLVRMANKKELTFSSLTQDAGSLKGEIVKMRKAMKAKHEVIFCEGDVEKP